jgi:hypothetical protein
MSQFKPGDLVKLNPTCESYSDATAQYIKQVLGPPRGELPNQRQDQAPAL